MSRGTAYELGTCGFDSHRPLQKCSSFSDPCAANKEKIRQLGGGLNPGWTQRLRVNTARTYNPDSGALFKTALSGARVEARPVGSCIISSIFFGFGERGTEKNLRRFVWQLFYIAQLSVHCASADSKILH
jgi:hypothetical protein